MLRVFVSFIAKLLGPILGKNARLYLDEKKDFFTTTGLLDYTILVSMAVRAWTSYPFMGSRPVALRTLPQSFTY